MSRQPLTWRNINAPNYGSSNTLLKDATDGINTSLGNAADNLTSLISRDVNQQKANWDQAKADNTLGLQNRINSFNDLAGYDAFQQSIMGELAGMGKQVDSANIINLLNGRDDTLRTNINAEQTFGDGQLTRQEAPQKAKINAAINAGKFDEARKLIDDSNIRDKSALEQSYKTGVTTADAKNEKNLMAAFIKDLAKYGSEEQAHAAALKFITANGIDQGTNAQDLVDRATSTWKSASKTTDEQTEYYKTAELEHEASMQKIQQAAQQEADKKFMRITQDDMQKLNDFSESSYTRIWDKYNSKRNLYGPWDFGLIDVAHDQLNKDVASFENRMRNDLFAKHLSESEKKSFDQIVNAHGGKLPVSVLDDIVTNFVDEDGDYTKSEFTDFTLRSLKDYLRRYNAMTGRNNMMNEAAQQVSDKTVKFNENLQKRKKEDKANNRASFFI
jgi:hypothetical protein